MFSDKVLREGGPLFLTKSLKDRRWSELKRRGKEWVEGSVKKKEELFQ